MQAGFMSVNPTVHVIGAAIGPGILLNTRWFKYYGR